MTVIVIAPDKFKGSLTAGQVADHLARGLARAGTGEEHQIRQVPMADGGEGTVDAALAAGWKPHQATVPGPLGSDVRARFALSADGHSAVVELAQASGLDLTTADPHSARSASSYGTGTLIRRALDAGAQHIILAVGGSACSDGGAGMIQALGGRLLDEQGRDLPGGGAALAGLSHLDLEGLDHRLASTQVTLAADVDNPLLGPTGAVAVYGQQKGADADALQDLEAGLARWAHVVAEQVPQGGRAVERPGAGAAGGVGFAALGLLAAERRSGIETVIALTGLKEQLQGATLAITGEGSLDEQSLYGKTPVGVAAAAREAGVPTVAVAGRSALTTAELQRHDIRACYRLGDLEPDPSVSMRDAGRLLEELAVTITANHL